MNKQEDGRQSEQRRRGTAGRLVVLLVGSAWRGGQGRGEGGVDSLVMLHVYCLVIPCEGLSEADGPLCSVSGTGR